MAAHGGARPEPEDIAGLTIEAAPAVPGTRQPAEGVVRRYVDALWNQGDAAVADEILTPDYVAHDPATPGRTGLEGEKRALRLYRAAFPDLRFEVEDQITEGHKVVVRWTSRGTHQGELLGVPPTGRQVTSSGITIMRLAGGRIAELWAHWDALGLLRQLGAVPVPGGPAAPSAPGEPPGGGPG